MLKWIMVAVLSIHVLTAVFWAGSTFVVARTNGLGADLLFRPQMAAATIAVLSGGYLWNLLHEGSFGLTEKILAGAAASAIVAMVVQGWLIGRVALRRQAVDQTALRSRIAFAYRAAAFLLAATVVGMAAARYA
jgi:uncharacterized membrane protein